MEANWHTINGAGIWIREYIGQWNIGVVGDFLFCLFRKLVNCPSYDNIGLYSCLSELLDRLLAWLCLQLARVGEVWDEDKVDIHAVLGP